MIGPSGKKDKALRISLLDQLILSLIDVQKQPNHKLHKPSTVTLKKKY